MRPGAAREALLRAARDLMGEKGLPQVTAREVAERARLNPGLVRYYFGGKHDLGKAFGGIFSHKGESNGSELNATYSSAHDEGSFAMKRP